MTDPRPVTENTASEKKVREARKRARFNQRVRSDQWRTVLDTEQGRRVLREIVEFCGVYRGGYRPGDEQQFDAGMKNVGCFVVAQMEEAQPNALELLRAQHEEDLKR